MISSFLFGGYTSQPGLLCHDKLHIHSSAYLQVALPATHSYSRSLTRISISDSTVDKRVNNKTKQIPFPYHRHTGHFPGLNIQMKCR